ncbi:hypothetical protein [Halofilum ochraceum]|uniref:hypothetical protein n=1 Tax=Halofilum ochraceum TaxID=1611323 RepID=UPI000833BCE0|nr:hypothetical protein [Halofilum ochraceum]
MKTHDNKLRNRPPPWVLIGVLSSLSAFAGTATAVGPVIHGDLRAQSLCIDFVAESDGSNCSTPANDGETRLEADVLRMRFLDSTAGVGEDGLGNSWSLLANDYSGAKNPQTYFGFTLRSLDPSPDDGGNDILGKHVLRIGPSTSANGSRDAVAIGRDSELVEGVVSLGSEFVQRRLANVAAAMQETDALIKRQLEEGVLGSVSGINDRLDELEGEVAALERRVSRDGGGSTGGGGGGGGLLGVPTLVFLAALLGITWRRRAVAV